MSAVSSQSQSAFSRRECKSILTPAPAAGAWYEREAAPELLSLMLPQRWAPSSNMAALGALSCCAPALLLMHMIEEVQALGGIPAAKARDEDACREESSAFPVAAESFSASKSLREAKPKSKGTKAKWVWQP